jgi:hypothetical protein
MKSAPGRELLAPLLALWALLVCVPSAASAQPPPIPAGLAAKGLTTAATPSAIADAFLGIPYRNDGTLDEQGRYTLFERPDQLFPTPGLNCSGLVVSLSRFLLARDITLPEAVRDRLGDSGEDAPLGKDWDFGWDLIWNVASLCTEPTVLMPRSATATRQGADGARQRGFALSDKAAWADVLARMRPGTMILASVSKIAASGPRHHHVAVILPLGNGRVRLIHATPRSGTHALEIGRPDGLDAFIGEMERGGTKKMILLLETSLSACRGKK